MPNTTYRTLSVVIPIGFIHDELKKLNFSISRSSTEVEYVLVNDLACEDSTELIKKLTKKHSRHKIRVVDGTFGSPGLARNAGMAQTSGDYIYFADCDDTFYADSVLRELQEIEIDVDVLIGNYRTLWEIDGNQKEFFLSKPEYLSIGINPGLWRIVIKSSHAKLQQFSDLRMAEDQLFLAKINLFRLKIHFTNQFFYEYTKQSRGSLTSQPDSMKDLLPAFKEIAGTVNGSFNSANYFKVVMLLRLFLANLKRGDAYQRFMATSAMVKISVTSFSKLLIFAFVAPKVVKKLVTSNHES